jgi:SH3 domain-containing YSC84-like protein 1
MRLILTATLALVPIAIGPLLAKDNEPAKRVIEAAAVFSEVMDAPDKGIPRELLENAHCIVIVPGLKTAAFVFGAKYGKGIMSCRQKAEWDGRRQARFALKAEASGSRLADLRPT